MVQGPFAAIERFIADIARADEATTLRALLEREVQRLGFEHFTYVLLWPSEGPRVPFWLTNYPPKWSAHYNQSDLKSHDVIFAHVAVAVRPFLWSELPPRDTLTKPQRLVFEDAIDFGLRAGGNIPLHGPGTARATLTVACNCEDGAFARLFAAHRHELQLVAQYAHERVVELGLDRGQTTRKNLTPREQDVLAWSAKGKTVFEIAIITETSVNTVKKRLATALGKLDAVNKAQAVAAAIRQGHVIP